MFTASQLKAALDGTAQYNAFTYDGAGVIHMSIYDVDHVELSCQCGGDLYGEESFPLAFYTDAELLETVNEWAEECASDLKNELGEAE